MTTILIVDDHAAFRRQARALLESEGLDIVAEASDGRSAMDAVRDLAPEIVVLDVGLPDIDGFAVADALAAQPAPPRVVLISSRDAATYAKRIASSSAVGFIQKDDLSAATLAALLGPL
jgi:two-component system nitrate/nitrite response regulator NarL